MSRFGRALVWFVALLMAVALVAGGCGQKAETEDTVTIPAEGGAAPVEKVSVTAAQLGVPLYGGLTKAPGQEQDGILTVTFTTPDSFEKVTSFYQGEYPNAMTTSSGDSLLLTVMDAKCSTVKITQGSPVSVTIEQQTN